MRLSLSLLIFSVLLTSTRAFAQTPMPDPPDSPRITPLLETEWNDDQRAILDALKRNGQVLNIFATLGRHPELMRNFLPFGGYILSGSGLPPRHREMLMLRIGWLCQSRYEWAQHARIAKAIGLSDEEIRGIAQGPDAACWDDFESTVLRAADELHYDAIVSDATWNALETQYSMEQILDAILTVGQYNQVSMALNSFGIQLEAGTPDSLPRDLPRPAPKDREEKPRLSSPRVAPLDKADWNDVQRELLEPVEAQGRLLNIYKTLARHPKMFGPRMVLGMYIRRNSTLPPRHREILILRTARLQQCDYEWGHHSRIGKEEGGLSQEEIDRIFQGPDAAGWSALDRALVSAADELHDYAFITDETWKVLSEQYTEQQLMDAVFTVSGYNMLAMLLNSAGVQRDEGVVGFP